ncbi:PREDICTED: uncharacterized protein LOC104782177 isoform X2 [Camelina sativa]|uniref:Uncharacterized protein LOC104782177 isoform X2 n=1 Tax=Camelina sativa TaxID=90675 RepID=A0ABM0YSS5_CAMSA|nr:PREDICTED: uncharacterized protein LOC104782177 isoform X2 [Camelina sativa]
MGEGTVCLEMPMEEIMAEDKMSSSMGQLKRERLDTTDEGGVKGDHFPNKKQAKEASNDDITSEISNPVASPVESTSLFRDVSSQPVKSDFGSEETISDGERGVTEDSSDVVLPSRFVLEIPKHLSSTGITKITFKLSKPKKEFDELPVVKDHTWDGGVVKMPKKIVSVSYPSTVNKLLETGILEGAPVKYISTPPVRELQGIIHSVGYLCGCASCNFSKVLSAFEFELHAGAKTRHPNNHIFLENGRAVYNILQEVKTAPRDVLEEVIRNIAGSALNEEGFQAWKASFQQSNSMSERNYITEHSTVRDNDLHRLLFMPNGLPDGTELAYYVKTQKLLQGYKQGSGILCSCCSREISPSQFESHAGMAARRQPYRHIYISSGLSLHDIAMSLANGHVITTGDSDDMCSICGDGGDLLLCAGCPQAFHTACLKFQSMPEGTWYCSSCNDGPVSCKKATATDPSSNLKAIVIRLTRVVKAPESEIGGCVFCRSHDFSIGKFDDRTVILCDQCEKEYHVGCLRANGLCDLKEIPQDKWFCCSDCSRIHAAVQSSVSCGPQTIPTPLLDMIRRKDREKGIYTDHGDTVEWRILSGKSRYPEHLPLLSRAAVIFRECFDPIVAKSGRDLIPVMVYGRNISGQEFGGMYCLVLIVNSLVVSAALLRIFGQQVAELPIVATSREYQGRGYFQGLYACVENLLSSLNVENLVLPAAEEAESIWTKKFGFTRMAEQQLLEYQKEVQLTIFKGTSMLEKKVPTACLSESTTLI